MPRHDLAPAPAPESTDLSDTVTQFTGYDFEHPNEAHDGATQDISDNEHQGDDVANAHQQDASNLRLLAEKTARERSSRRAVRNAYDEYTTAYDRYNIPQSRTRRLGRAIARFARRTMGALRAAHNSWIADSPTNSPTAQPSSPFQPSADFGSFDKRKSMLQDAANQYHQAKRVDADTQPTTTPETTRPDKAPWGGGLVLDKDGNAYYRPLDASEVPEPPTAVEAPVTSPRAPSGESSVTPEVDDPTHHQERYQQTSAEVTSQDTTPDTPESTSQDLPDNTEQVDGISENETTPQQHIGDFISSTTGPENMEEVLASFDPNHNYSYSEAMEMIPDKKGYRNYWENSILEKHDINNMPALGEIARALIVKDIHESIAKARQAMEDGRLSEGEKLRGNVGTIIGRSGVGSEYLRNQAAGRGLISQDKNSFEAEGMSFSELAKLIGIDTSTIEGYDEIYA